ncbi:hypothetical protein TNCT_348841 [Trichonephila clavata]|uniref:Uncharacterized protein n=1 Tax=Trichonephila clavata TaxID=2740835 RepID=A0A8X6KVJ7_TRICU|nr:hypothetical protein TNCT_348841 [Trichonephila clavata]
MFWISARPSSKEGSSPLLQICAVWRVTPDFPPEPLLQFLRSLSSMKLGIAMQEDDTFTRHGRQFVSDVFV